jgi:hypothetical protein
MCASLSISKISSRFLGGKYNYGQKDTSYFKVKDRRFRNTNEEYRAGPLPQGGI